MKYFKHSVLSLFLGVQAFVLTYIDDFLKTKLGPDEKINFLGLADNPLDVGLGFVYVAFIGWAVYFFAGATIEGGVRAVIAFFLGQIGALGMVWIGEIGGNALFMIALGILVFSAAINMLELTPKWFNLLPAAFAACATFFGLYLHSFGGTTDQILNTLLLENVYLWCGLITGFITILFRTWFDKVWVLKEEAK